MIEKIIIGDFVIKAVYAEKEVNFTVYEHGNYLFRLVPQEEGFGTSKLDKALQDGIEERVIMKMGDFIQNYYS